MKRHQALAALAALAQDNRLDVFRLLVEAGREGMPAGAVADALKLAPNTLTFHFDRLREAGLVAVRRDGRSMIYAARYDTMNALLSYLTENCCREMRINARLRQAQARRPRLGKRSQCDETLSMGALLHLFPRAHGGGAQGSASSGDCRSRRRLRDNDRSCRQTSCSHSHQGRRSAYAREHGYGRVHRQPRCTYSRRPAAK